MSEFHPTERNPTYVGGKNSSTDSNPWVSPEDIPHSSHEGDFRSLTACLVELREAELALESDRSLSESALKAVEESYQQVKTIREELVNEIAASIPEFRKFRKTLQESIVKAMKSLSPRSELEKLKGSSGRRLLNGNLTDLAVFVHLGSVLWLTSVLTTLTMDAMSKSEASHEVLSNFLENGVFRVTTIVTLVGLPFTSLLMGYLSRQDSKVVNNVISRIQDSLEDESTKS